LSLVSLPNLGKASRTADAIKYHSRLMQLWSDCDPELIPVRDEIALRLRALIG